MSLSILDDTHLGRRGDVQLNIFYEFPVLYDSMMRSIIEIVNALNG